MESGKIDYKLLAIIEEETKPWCHIDQLARIFSPNTVQAIGTANYPTLKEIMALLACPLDISNGEQCKTCLECLKVSNAARRETLCAPRFAIRRRDTKCRALAEPQLVERKSTPLGFTDDEKKEEPVIAPAIPLDFIEVFSKWRSHELYIQSGKCTPIPQAFDNILTQIADKGLGAFQERLCDIDRCCSGNCENCIDGVMQGECKARQEFFYGLMQYGRPLNNYQVPQIITTKYKKLGSTPDTRLTAVQTILNASQQ